MIKKTISLYDDVIFLGYQGTHDVLQIDIDIGEWVGSLGVDGVALIKAQRKGDSMGYPASRVSYADGVITWIPDATDTAVHGYGECQVNFTPSVEGLQRSKIFKTVVPESMGNDSAEPADLPLWEDVFLALAAEAAGSAHDAGESATTAVNAADTATQGAQTATEAAQTATNAAETATNAEASAVEANRQARIYSSSAEQSKISAEDAAQSAITSADTAIAKAGEAERYAGSASVDAQRAEQAAAQSGYMWFYIENGRLYMDKTSNTRVDFFMRDGKLYVEEVA